MESDAGRVSRNNRRMSSAPLNALTTGSYAQLEWRQLKSLSRDGQLLMDGREIGSLAFRSSMGTLATAKVGDACWTFKRVGFFQQRVDVRECGADASIGQFVNATWSGGGTLTVSGRTFKATTNFWSTKWQVEDADGRVLLRFDYGGVFKRRANVKVAAAARAVPELALLIALSWYLVVMLWAEQESAVIIG